MMEKKEGEVMDEIERQVEDLKLESIVNETVSPNKPNANHTVDLLAKPEAPRQPQEENKDANYSV